MRKKIKNSLFFKYTAELIARYRLDDLSGMSAQITYYLILAFFPFLLFVINLLSFTTLSSEVLIANFNNFLPTDTGTLIKNLLIETVQGKSKTLLVLGMFGSLWASSQGITALIQGLNKAYAVEETRHFTKLYLISLIATFGVALMIIFDFTLVVFGKIIASYLFELAGVKAFFYTVWGIVRYAIPLPLMLLTFYLLYAYVPNKKLKSTYIILGSIFASGGWLSASLLFSFYVNMFTNYEKIYGSIGGIIALITWLYLSTLIILIGGELIAILSHFENRKKR
ncbi:YihY/virulence factor BrkB family protein [Propionispira raffinosivorans]|uniref:YihY/virulence factor BrkB family protein n=1 Tax=Propionispira raffinosivorans TaxID=86959 RepID=UPI000373C020|nr:YihY/virulence factor BrkB family protein [Propionispira raffinosivorans]